MLLGAGKRPHFQEETKEVSRDERLPEELHPQEDERKPRARARPVAPVLRHERPLHNLPDPQELEGTGELFLRPGGHAHDCRPARAGPELRNPSPLPEVSVPETFPGRMDAPSTAKRRTMNGKDKPL